MIPSECVSIAISIAVANNKLPQLNGKPNADLDKDSILALYTTNTFSCQRLFY